MDKFSEITLPNGPTEIPQPKSIPKMTYGISEDSKSAWIKFDTQDQKYSTLFGGKINEPIYLDESAIYRLPHNLVLSCLTDELPGEIGGLSPDILLRNEDETVDAIEVGTTQSPHITKLRQLVLQKLLKYSELIEGSYLRKLNIVAVNPTTVMTATGFMTGEYAARLIYAYRQGLTVLREFEIRHGTMRGEEDPEKHTLFKGMLNSLKPTDKWSEIWERDSILRIGRRTYEKIPETWDSFFRRTAEGRVEKDTMVHMPFILCNKRRHGDPLDIPDLPHGNGAYNEIIRSIPYSLFDKPDLDFDELEILSSARQGIQRKNKDYDDAFKCLLSESQRIELAMRGVMKKELSVKGIDAVKMKELLSKKPYSILADTSDVEDYIRTDMQIEQEPAWSMDEMKFATTTDQSGDLTDLLQQSLRLTDINRVFFLELILRELAYNMDRNPNDVGNKKEFIARRIPGFMAFVIIRTTRMGGKDGAPVFGFVLYQGETNTEPLFEQTFRVSGAWRRTDFFSMTRHKLEHCQGILSQSISLLGLCSEHFLQGIKPQLNGEDWRVFYPTYRMLLLILLEDKTHTSQNMQLLRYYYMELFSGLKTFKINSLKILSKITVPIRSRLCVYIYNKLRAIHESIPDDFYLKGFSTSAKKIGEEEEEEEDTPESGSSVEFADEEKQLTSEPIMSPFGFLITSADEMMLSSYVCMLHNKNEMNYGHGAIQILEKLCKRMTQSYKLTESFRGHEKLFHTVQGANIDPDTMEEFQHSESAVALGAHLTKKRLMKVHNVKDHQWDLFLEKRIISFLLKTLIEEMATTKSSTLPFDPDLMISKDGEEIKSVGQRRKCFHQMYNLMEQMDHPEICLNIQTILKGIQIEENNCILVTLFKKNQIGGTREIFVLTMRGRLLIRIFCDIFRAICDLHPCEILTDDSHKDKFVSEHFAKVHEIKPEGHMTAKVSGDMTNWAQMFSMFEFESMTKSIVPKCFWPLCQIVLKMHRDKQIQLPRETVEMFLSNPGSELTSESVNQLKKIFYGEAAEFMAPHHCSVQAKTDMMQGILHYPSSLYHILHMEYLQNLIENWAAKKEIKVIMSFEVSSDDEGILITLTGARSSVSSMAKELRSLYPRIKQTVDALFGVRTSFEKTTFSFTEIFEFNSKFYIGNTVVSPLIKFMARVTDDNPQESLMRRVSSLYSSLRQLRENGASGYLCSWASFCQAISYYMNLGFKTMPWYRDNLLAEINPYKITPLGHYAILSPMIAGLADGVYVNWLSSKDSKDARKLLYHLSSYGLPQDIDDLEVATFGVYPRKKYLRVLNDLGLKGLHKSDFVTDENFESYLTGAKTLQETKDHMSRKILDPSVAASLSWMTRTESTRMTPYLLWSSMFKSKDSDWKLSLRGLVENILNRPGESLETEVLFPMWKQFLYINNLTKQELYMLPLNVKRRLRYQWVSPFYLFGDHQAHTKEVLREIWFKVRSKKFGVSKIQTMWEDIVTDLPFLRSTGPKDSLERSPFKTYDQLLGYLESYTNSNKSVRLLARGTTDNLGQSVDRMMRFNICPYLHFRSKTDAASILMIDQMKELINIRSVPVIDPRVTKIITRMEDRLQAWYGMLANIESQYESETLYELYKDTQESLRSLLIQYHVSLDGIKGSSTGTQRLDNLRNNLLLMCGVITADELFQKNKNVTLWLMPEQLRGSKWVGDYIKIQKREDILVRIEKAEGETIFYSNRPEYAIREVYPKSQIDRVFPEHIKIPRYKAESIVLFKGSRLILLRSLDDPGNIAYMTMPDAKITMDHLKLPGDRPWPGALSKWLSRQSLSEDDIDGIIDGYNQNDWIGSCIRSLCIKIGKMSFGGDLIQIQERVGKSAERNISSLPINIEANLMEWADSFLPQTAEDLIADQRDAFADAYVDMAAGLVYEDLGLEAFSLESSFTNIELNRTLKDLTQMINGISRLPRRKLEGSAIGEFMKWYDQMRMDL